LELGSNVVCINAITLLVGIGVFVGGQIIAKFLIEPIYEQRRLIRDIADSVWLYGNLYSNPARDGSPERDEAYRVLRQRGSQLMAATNAIPFYSLWQQLPGVPKWENVVETWGHLVRLSNGVYMGDPVESLEVAGKVFRRLGIKTRAERAPQ